MMHTAPTTPAESSLMGMQTQVRRDQRCEASTTSDHWQQFLTDLATDKRAAVSQRRRFRVMGWLACVVAVVSCLSIATLNPSAILWVIPPGLLILGIVALRHARSLQRQDVPSHMIQFALRLLAVLRADMLPAEPLRLRLDLRGGTIKAKQREMRPPARGKRTYPQIAETWYVDPWLAGETRLVDGSTLTWRVVDRIRERTLTKKNPRGKIKRKTRYRVKRCIDVRLGVRQDIYSPRPALRPTQDHLSLRSGVKRHVVKGRRVITTGTPEAVPQVRDLLDLIAQAYQQVTPRRGKGQA